MGCIWCHFLQPNRCLSETVARIAHLPAPVCLQVTNQKHALFLGSENTPGGHITFLCCRLPPLSPPKLPLAAAAHEQRRLLFLFLKTLGGVTVLEVKETKFQSRSGRHECVGFDQRYRYISLFTVIKPQHTSTVYSPSSV